MTDDICGFPDLGPKDELVGHSAEAYKSRIRNRLGPEALFATDIDRSGWFIQINSMRDKIVIGGHKLDWINLYLVKRDDVWAL